VAFDASATDYIKKPFEEVELLARVKATLKLKKEPTRGRTGSRN